MKRKFCAGLVVCSSFLSHSAIANAVALERSTLQPYVGLDLEVKELRFKENGGKDLFAKRYPQGNIYAGIKFNENVGLELGYEQSAHKKKNKDVAPGENMIGAINTTTNTFNRKFTSKINGFHVDVIGFFKPMADYETQLFASIGLGLKQVKLKTEILGINGIAYADALKQSYDRNFKKRKAIMRAAVGVQHMVTDCVGLRATFGWENTARFKNLVSKEAPSSTTQPSLKNTINYGLGFFYTF